MLLNGLCLCVPLTTCFKQITRLSYLYLNYADIDLPLSANIQQDETELLESIDPREKSKNDKQKWIDFALEDIVQQT